MTQVSIEVDLEILVFLNSEACNGWLRSLRVWWLESLQRVTWKSSSLCKEGLENPKLFDDLGVYRGW